MRALLPTGHHVQFYEREAFIVDSVARFVGAGLGASEAVVVIATAPHLAALSDRLERRGLHLASRELEGRYVALDAEALLAQWMVQGRVDALQFAQTVGGAIARAAGPARTPVRVFGEMVSLLWADGKHEAAIELEALWNDLGRGLPFSLLCAYPLAGFANEADEASFLAVCAEHSEIIPGESYVTLKSGAERNRAIAQLQRKARVLELEIARRKEIQESLRQRNQTLHALIAASPLPIVVIEPDTTVRLWNPSAERIFGWTEQEVVGRPIPIIPPDKREEAASVREAAVRGEMRSGMATRRLHKDGHSIEVLVSAAPIGDDEGKPSAVVLLFEDVTESKRGERAVEKTHRELATLYEMGRVLSAELDLERLLQALTDAATQLSNARFGAFHPATAERMTEHVLVARAGAPHDGFDPFGRARELAILEPTFEGERLVRIDDLRRDPRYVGSEPDAAGPGGQESVVSYLAVGVVGRTGEVFGGLFLGHPEPAVFGEEAERVVLGLAAQAAVAIENARLYDGERRARNEAETANRAKDEFLAMLGHELRNPLAALRNAVLSARFDPTSRDHAMEIADRGIDQLTRLVDDLLDVARITRGRIMLRKRLVPICDVVESAVESTRRLIEDRAHALTLLLPDSDVRLDADAVRLEQVVVNLISNAAKFTDRGGRIRITAQRENDEVVIRVRDSGIGIASEMLPRVFDLFTQADRPLDRSEGGLGIGLTVARRLVELHGGSVHAYSDGPGRGAEFVVRIPGVVVAREAVEIAPSAEVAPHAARVLVVEDNLDAAESLGMLLEALGHHVVVVHDGPRALEVVRSESFDVILMDVGLPVMDGYEVARRMRRDLESRSVKIVALTGYGRDEDRQLAIASGFDLHLVKPVYVDVLKDVLAQAASALPGGRASS